MNIYESWREEKRSAYLYQLLAEKETGRKQQMFSQLASAAEQQADLWLQELQKNGRKLPAAFELDWRTQIVAWLIKRLNLSQLRQILPAMKIRGMAAYLRDEPSHPMPVSIADVGLRHQKPSSSGNLRAAVFGINDGLVSNVSLIMGMAGANANHNTIVLAGIAGLLAGAFSMAAGEFISVRSQREMLEYQIALEKKELELYPAEESAELALIYQARGLEKAEAKKIADHIISNPQTALEVLTREELGLNPNELGSPLWAGFFSFFFFSIGALVPLLPFLFGNHGWNFSAAIALTASTLFLVGASLSLFTGRNGWWAGLRMLIIGSAAGGLTYLIGYILGVSLS